MKYIVTPYPRGRYIDSNKNRFNISKVADSVTDDKIPSGAKLVTASSEDAVAESEGFRNMLPTLKLNPIAAGAAFVLKSGFDADKKVILLNKLLKVKEADALAANPKLVALYTWMETVQAMAVAGQTSFPEAPYKFEEVVAE